MNKAVSGIFPVVLLIAGFLFLTLDAIDFFENPEAKEKTYEIERKWNLPDILEEVSGIAWLSENRIACVQDEDGIIFIYDLEKSEIEKEITFAKGGDYEGLVIDGTTAYVLRSDGEIFEIENFEDEDVMVNQYQTSLTRKQDVEGLGLDKVNDRLLLAIKAREPEKKKNYKGIYGFSLTDKTMEEEPVYRLMFEDHVFKDVDANQSHRTIHPSEITVNSETGKMYVLDAVEPKLLILNENGIPEKLHFLNKKEFYQPEGITFSPSGEMFISNEGNRGNPANILEVTLH